MEKEVNILRCVFVMMFALLPISHAFSQEIRTSAPDEVLENEVFQIQYDIVSVTPVQAMPQMVDNKDFELIGEPKVSRSYPSPFWGRDYYMLRIICRFKAKKSGNLKLPRIELNTEVGKLSSEKRELVVRQLPEMGNVKCFVDVDLTKWSVRIGDTLTITYKLYSTKEISSVRKLTMPRLRDIYIQDVTPRQLTFSEETINGVEYKVYVIRKLRLQSTMLGVNKLPEGSVEVDYTYPTGKIRQDTWGRSYEEQLRETKSCDIEAVEIRVHNMISI